MMSGIEQSMKEPSRIVPPISALLAFERAGARLSFRRAAQDLRLSPSAVSHQIQSLEERFGVQLFIRAGRSVTLTKDGARYLESVRNALIQLERGSRDLMARGRNTHRVLRISATPFFAQTVIIPALAKFRASHPRIDLHIDTTHQYADFGEGQVDAAIRYGREKAQGLKLQPLVAVHSRPVCAPRLTSGLRSPADLAKTTLLNLASQPRAWPAWLSDHGMEQPAAQPQLWFDSVPAVLEAAQYGLGVALAMDPLIRGWASYGTGLVAPFAVQARRTATFYLVTRPQDAHDRRIQSFRRWLTAAVDAVVSGAGAPGG